MTGYYNFFNDIFIISIEQVADSTKDKIKKPASEKPKYKKSQQSSTPSTAAAGSNDIFGDGEEEDDLFGAPPKKPDVKTTSKQEPTPQSQQEPSNSEVDGKIPPKTSKINTKSNSLFSDEEDDLFGKPTPKPTPPQTTSETMTSKMQDDGKVSSSTSVSAKISNKKMSAGLFSSVSDEEDDLFGTRSSVKPTPTTTTTITATAPIEKEAEKEVEKEVETVDQPNTAIIKPKKPTGGVSMFGGIDPFAARKNLKSPTGGASTKKNTGSRSL